MDAPTATATATAGISSTSTNTGPGPGPGTSPGPGTNASTSTAKVVYLYPRNGPATAIVNNPANSDRRCENAIETIQGPSLCIALDKNPPETPPSIIRFGRHHLNEVESDHFAEGDGCYLDLHPNTGELMLHDTSKHGSTQLYGGRSSRSLLKPLIHQAPRQCVVFCGSKMNAAYDIWWGLAIGAAEFNLYPRRDARASPSQKNFEDTTTVPDTIAGSLTHLSLEPVTSRPHLPRAMPPSAGPPGSDATQTQPAANDKRVIEYRRIEKLGSGGQGSVFKVVDLHSGQHLACKVLMVKSPTARAKAKLEADQLAKLRHDYIVPFIHSQGTDQGPQVEIFMPICDGSLDNLLAEQIKYPGAKSWEDLVLRTMLPQILLAVDYLHNQARVIHRDIKTSNIFFEYHHQGINFLLGDFGVAHVNDVSAVTDTGTLLFQAPEVGHISQTASSDIYSLGMTIAYCFAAITLPICRFTASANRPSRITLKDCLEKDYPQYLPMVDYAIHVRPTARGLLIEHFPDLAKDLSPLPVETFANESPSELVHPAARGDEEGQSNKLVTVVGTAGREERTGRLQTKTKDQGKIKKSQRRPAEKNKRKVMLTQAALTMMDGKP